MKKYMLAIKDNICSICVDSDEKGSCTLNQKEICAVEYFLPQIVKAIHQTQSENMDDYYKSLKDIVCTECKAKDDEGGCYLRENSNCSLDRYFSLIVETIHKVDSQIN